jgi:hypothetical protein
MRCIPTAHKLIFQDGGLKTNLGSHFRKCCYKDGTELEILESKDDLKDSSLQKLLLEEFGLAVWPITPKMRDFIEFNT